MNTQTSKPNGDPRKSKANRLKPDRTLSHGEPAEPLLRVLPIKRWIPQDVHSMMDYADGLTVASGYFTGRRRCRVLGEHRLGRLGDRRRR